MKITATFTVTKVDGRKQDEEAIREALSDELDGIQSFFVDDGEREGESEYEADHALAARILSPGGRPVTSRWRAVSVPAASRW